jgi:hypothetical protein
MDVGVSNWDVAFAFGSGQSVRDFDRDDVRCVQFMDTGLRIRSETNGFVRVFSGITHLSATLASRTYFILGHGLPESNQPQY